MMTTGWMLWAVLGQAVQPAGVDLFVSPRGQDTWSGLKAEANAAKTDGPFASLERARDEIRSRREAKTLPAGPITVHIAGGVYWRDATFQLTRADSGSKEAPIVYRAEPGQPARLIGGRRVTAWKPVTEPAVLERLEAPARGKVMEADLKVAGVSDFGKMSSRGFGRPVMPAGLELFWGDRPMQLARWPNHGYVKIAAVPAGPQGGKFTYEGDRPQRWSHADDIWVHGFWTWDWAESYEKVKSLDVEKHEIATEPPHGVYGYNPGKRFYVLNVLEELDTPGEWYLDRKSAKIYFWPPSGEGNQEEALVSVISDGVNLRDVSFVTLQGLFFEALRGNGVVVTGGDHDVIAGCTLRNIGNLGVVIEGSTESGVRDCDLTGTGDGGVVLTGGERKTLTPGGLFADNNHIWNFSRWDKTYRPAVSINGVGNRVSHNLMNDAPHMAIGLSGNEHVIEFNEIHSVCMECDDCGAFYMGRDWTQRGNVIRYNYFHDLGGVHSSVGTMAVYLDDWTSGTTVVGNICWKAGRGIMVGGGRDNSVENNIFVDSAPVAVHVDSRGLGWGKYYFDGKDTTLTDRLKDMPYEQPPWSTKYPELLALYADEPALAKGNKIVRNICVGSKWLQLLDGLTDQVVQIRDNLVDQDPRFVDAAKGDFNLKPDSPALKLGFKPIPMDQIGLQRKRR